MLGLLLVLGTIAPSFKNVGNLHGAWRLVKTSDKSAAMTTTIQIITQKHYIFSNYDTLQQKFIGAGGGTYTSANDQFTATVEFDSRDSIKVGQQFACPIKWRNGRLELVRQQNGRKIKETWARIDDGGAANSPLAAIWRFSGRKNPEGQIVMSQRGPRKTIKLLSGTRFQWAAINTETKQFFGCGGGTYRTENGKYLETLAFFSRDNSRVGTQLTFDFEVKPDGWHHQGLSSKGEKIYEIWSKDE